MMKWTNDPGLSNIPSKKKSRSSSTKYFPGDLRGRTINPVEKSSATASTTTLNIDETCTDNYPPIIRLLSASSRYIAIQQGFKLVS